MFYYYEKSLEEEICHDCAYFYAGQFKARRDAQ